MASKQTMGAAMIIQGMNAPESPVPPTATAWNGVAALPQLGVIRAQGEEAAAFLQSQLTQDMAAIAPGQARLAGLCNAKGRMLASFVACRHAPDEFWLVCSRDLLAATLKKLSMFVLRAKVKLSDASDELTVHGVLGSACNSVASSADVAGAEGRNDATFAAALPPADGCARALWIGPAGHPPPAGPALPAALWDWAAVRSGVATVTAPVVAAFEPQMLNYDSVDGVSFKKGCSPGQEVVARSQFRGAIKRRAYVGWVDGLVQAGQDVFASASGAEPVGVIAQAAPAIDPVPGGTAVIAVLRCEDAETHGAGLRVGAAAGPALHAPTMAYPLRDDL